MVVFSHNDSSNDNPLCMSGPTLPPPVLCTKVMLTAKTPWNPSTTGRSSNAKSPLSARVCRRFAPWLRISSRQWWERTLPAMRRVRRRMRTAITGRFRRVVGRRCRMLLGGRLRGIVLFLCMMLMLVDVNVDGICGMYYWYVFIIIVVIIIKVVHNP